jgi:hypothetical protein
MFVQQKIIAWSMQMLMEVAEAHYWNSRFWVVATDQTYPVHCKHGENYFFSLYGSM